MRRNALFFVVMIAIALFTSAVLAFQTATDGPYKVLKTAKVGGEGGTDACVAPRVMYSRRPAVSAKM